MFILEGNGCEWGYRVTYKDINAWNFGAIVRNACQHTWVGRKTRAETAGSLSFCMIYPLFCPCVQVLKSVWDYGHWNRIALEAVLVISLF